MSGVEKQGQIKHIAPVPRGQRQLLQVRKIFQRGYYEYIRSGIWYRIPTFELLVVVEQHVRDPRILFLFYSLAWQSLSPDVSPMDCYPVGDNFRQGHWYGGGETTSGKWPLDKGQIQLSAFITGDEVPMPHIPTLQNPQLFFVSGPHSMG